MNTTLENSANNGISNHTNCRGTIDDISTRKRTKGAWQKVKREHDTRFPKGEEHLHFDGDIHENWMETTKSPQHFQHLQQHL